MRLLTNEEIALIVGEAKDWAELPHRTAQAQLDQDKQELFKAFEDGYNMGARDADRDNKE